MSDDVEREISEAAYGRAARSCAASPSDRRLQSRRRLPSRWPASRPFRRTPNPGLSNCNSTMIGLNSTSEIGCPNQFGGGFDGRDEIWAPLNRLHHILVGAAATVRRAPRHAALGRHHRTRRGRPPGRVPAIAGGARRRDRRRRHGLRGRIGRGGRRHGAVLGFEPWQGDFATPPETALARSLLGEWILYIDADERVPRRRQPEERRSLVSPPPPITPRSGSWFVPRVGWTPYVEYRLWRHGPDVRFRGRMQ